MAFNALPLANDVASSIQQHQQRECVMPKGDFLTYDQFILFGDSITEGSANQDGGFGLFPALAHDYARRLDVINRGFSGYNTVRGRAIFHQFFPPPEIARVRFLLIFFGANDSIIDADGHFPISIENYKLNLEEIIQHPATRAQNPRILLVTPPPVNEYAQIEVDSEKGHSHLRRSAGTTRKYAEACLQVAKSTTGVVGVDIWSALMKEAGWDGDGDRLPGSMQILPNKTLQKLMYDGLHLSADGYRLVYQEIMKAIKEEWPDQTPENLLMNFPVWESFSEYYR